MHLNLLPPQITQGCTNEFTLSGRALSATLSPADNSLAAFITNVTLLSDDRRDAVETPIYFTSLDEPPSSERRLFITDTYVIFEALQNLLKPGIDDPGWARNEEVLNVIRKLGNDYLNHVKECWIHTSQLTGHTENALQYDSDHYRSMYTSFSLFIVLYLPEPAFEHAPVGDDLMEWLNIHFIDPSNEEGDHLSKLDRPWEDDSFWPYLTRATIRGLTKASKFFLEVLNRHPSDHLRPFAERLIPLVGSQPRMLKYHSEKDFVFAFHRWTDKVKALRIDLDHVPKAKRTDGFENWWDRLSDIVGVLEGRGDVIQRVCIELGSDWKEVIAAWCIFVDPRLRRDSLPDVVGPILDEMPPDPTDMEDMIHSALLTGQPQRALTYAEHLDCWLAAHFADLMSPLGLLETDDQLEVSVRDQHVLAYAEYLHSDPALWQLTVAYMCSCGEIGKKSADEVLLRVPLRLVNPSPNNGESRVDGKIRAREVVGVLKAVNESCLEFQRENVRRSVCRIAAQTFIREKEYRLAMSYCTSAENWAALGRVIDCILNEFVVNGRDEFLRCVADIAPSLETIRANSSLQGIFLHRLEFAVRYAEFQQHRLDKRLQDCAWDLVDMFQEEIAPKSWWGVLLFDSVEYLQHGSSLLFTTTGACQLFEKLEEVFVRTSQGSGEDYLAVFSDLTKSGEKECLQRLMVVRFALARYFARCTMIGVGGRHAPEIRSNRTEF